MASTSELFAGINDRLAQNQAKLAGTTATYLFQLSGDDGGAYHIVLENGVGKAGAGAPANPGCTILMDANDFKAMIAGQLSAVSAFMGGKLRIQGDMGLAMKLQTLLQ